MWKLNNANSQWNKEQIKKEIRNYFEINKNEDTHTKTYWVQLQQCLEENV